jgi:hypothetical protein
MELASPSSARRWIRALILPFANISPSLVSPSVDASGLVFDEMFSVVNPRSENQC